MCRCWPGTGSAPSPVDTWIGPLNFTHVQFQTAATSNNILLYTLPIKGIVEAAVIKQSTAFAGTGITKYEIGLGIVGELFRIAPFFDVSQAVAGDYFQLTDTLDAFSFTGTTLLQIAAKSTGANLNQSTAGIVDIWLMISQLP